MRMWMVDPKVMCKKHLLGEHLELHMFVGVIKKGISVEGYVRNNLLEFKSILQRHEQLVEEMKRRGYKHNSELELPNNAEVSKEIIESKINTDLSLRDLIHRCNECKERLLIYYKKEDVI